MKAKGGQRSELVFMLNALRLAFIVQRLAFNP